MEKPSSGSSVCADSSPPQTYRFFLLQLAHNRSIRALHFRNAPKRHMPVCHDCILVNLKIQCLTLCTHAAVPASHVEFRSTSTPSTGVSPSLPYFRYKSAPQISAMASTPTRHALYFLQFIFLSSCPFLHHLHDLCIIMPVLTDIMYRTTDKSTRLLFL